MTPEQHDKPACGARSTPQRDVQQLVDLIRGGDREAAAEFVGVFGPMMLRRIRGRLTASMRRLFDSQDLLSTVTRRLDRYVGQHRATVLNEAQLVTLIRRIIDAALIDKARVMQRLARVESEDSEFVHALRHKLESSEREGREDMLIEMARAYEHVDDPIDREIFTMWIHGNEWAVVAEQLEMTPGAVRVRWYEIRKRLHAQWIRGNI